MVIGVFLEEFNRFRKKMNFTTDLPKKRPCVTYIVASAVKCGKFFPNSKEEGPSFRMHAVILNREGIQTQKYKNKDGAQNLNCMDELHSTLSTTCSSIADNVEIEKNELNGFDGPENKKNSKKDKKNYVLCHIRKIDQNYKAAKSAGKRENSNEEDEDDEEIDDDSDTQNFGRKIVCTQSARDSVEMTKQKSINEEFTSKQRALNGDFERSVHNDKSPRFTGFPQANSNNKAFSLGAYQGYKGTNSNQNFKASPVQRMDGRLNEDYQLKDRIMINTRTSTNKDKGIMSQLPKGDFSNVDYLALFSNLVYSKKC